MNELLLEMEVIKGDNKPGYLQHEVATLKRIVRKRDNEIKEFKATLAEFKRQIDEATEKADSKENS